MRVALLGDSISDPMMTRYMGRKQYWSYLEDWLQLQVYDYAVSGMEWNDVPRQLGKLEEEHGADVDAKGNRTLGLRSEENPIKSTMQLFDKFITGLQNPGRSVRINFTYSFDRAYLLCHERRFTLLSCWFFVNSHR